mgnify:CR=1 FL=1
MFSRENVLETTLPSEADCILINSCAVTSRAVQDVRKSARRFYRENPRVSTVITGCAVKHFQEELKELPGVVELVPQEEKDQVADLIRGMYTGGELLERKIYTEGFFSLEDLSISSFPRARPVLKVQDGCSRVCTYCIVPHTRGSARSRDPDDIIKEIDRLYQNGFREVVISGINLSQYKYASKQLADFWDLIAWLDGELCRHFAGEMRMRLSSLDPSLLDLKGLQILTRSISICPHLHLSLQSASPDILRRMGRSHYSSSDIEKFIQELNKSWSVYGLGADILLGFPGESDSDFCKTYELVQRLPFSYGHVFVFSPRPDTRAYQMRPVVSRQDKKMRSQKMQELLQSKKRAFLQRLVNISSLRVVLEQEDPALGMNEYYTLSFFSRGSEDNFQASLVEAIPISAGEQGLHVEKA